jgi:ADP-ribose pyrophosphatase YjhB (NUDIX family)
MTKNINRDGKIAKTDLGGISTSGNFKVNQSSFWWLTKPVTTRGICIKNGKILVVKTTKDKDVYYTIPGGHPKDLEHPKLACLREIQEETGILCMVGQEKYRFYMIEDEARGNGWVACYICEPVGGKLYCSEAEKKWKLTQNKTVEPMWIEMDDFAKGKSKYPFLRDAIVEGWKNSEGWESVFRHPKLLEELIIC